MLVFHHHDRITEKNHWLTSSGVSINGHWIPLPVMRQNIMVSIVWREKAAQIMTGGRERNKESANKGRDKICPSEAQPRWHTSSSCALLSCCPFSCEPISEVSTLKIQSPLQTKPLNFATLGIQYPSLWGDLDNLLFKP